VKTKIKGLGFLHSFPFSFDPDRPVPDQLFHLQSQQITLPLPTVVMTCVHDFVVDLAKGGKSFREIKKLVDDVHRDKALKKTQIYEILKRVKMGKNTDDRRGFKTPKTAMTADLIASDPGPC
jgi:hypothetical protein